jgi:hypothetical protein
MALFVLMRYVYSFLFLILLLASSCRKEKFSYESNWVTPLVETKLTLGDLVPDSLLNKNNDSSLNVIFEAEYAVNNLDDILQIPDRVESVEVSLTSLVLEDRSFTDTLTLLELYPPSLFLNGTEASLPAQEIVTNEGTVLDVTEQFFTTATFKEGFIDISISNDLPVEAEVLEFELRNFEDKSVIVSGVFNDVFPNTTVSESYDLAGKTVDGVLELIVIKVKTRASNGDVLIDASKGIRTTITIRDLKPQVATAIFPAQNLVEREDETKYEFGGAELTQVYVKSGFILMKVESSIEEAIVLNYSIPNSSRWDAPGISITKQWTIPAAPKGETVFVEEKFPIDSFNIFLWGEILGNAPDYNHVYNELTASIKYSGVERTLSLDDKISIEFGLIDVKPDLVIGDPGQHDFGTRDTVMLKAFDNLSGKILLDDAKISLDFYNSFGIQASVTVNELISENTNNGKKVKLSPMGELSSTILLEKATNPPLIAFEKSIILDKSNSNVKQFLENMPNKLYPDLDVVIRPNGTVNRNDFAFAQSKVAVNFKIEAPLTIGLDSFSLTTTEEFNLLGDNNETQNIKEGRLLLKVKNSFPFEGDLKLQFIDRQGKLLFEKLPDAGSRMSAAEVDAVTGKTVGQVESEVAVSISRTEFQLLKSAEQVEVTVILNTKDATRYKMYSDYGVEVQLITNFIYENKL